MTDLVKGGIVGFILGCFITFFIFEKHSPLSDPACHVVHHSDSDGFKYWSCEKN